MSNIFLIFYGRFSKKYFMYVPPIMYEQRTPTLAGRHGLDGPHLPFPVRGLWTLCLLALMVLCFG